MALTKVTGELIDIGDLDLSDVGTISLDAIQGDADANTSITFSGSDVITIATGGSGRLTIGDGALSPVTNNQIDLGTASLEFKNAFFDGTVTADAFAGPLTGNVTGNASGTALTVTQAAQTAITSLGTLTALTVDNLGINGNTITANSGALNITPAGGSAIVLDGTINVDAGVVTGATSITSTAFVGGLTGNVTGNASGTALTVTQAAQTAITSVGTLTALTVTGSSSYPLTVKSSDADAADIFRIIADDDGAVVTVSKDASDNAEMYLWSGAGGANTKLGGNSVSYFQGGNVAIGATTAAALLTITDNDNSTMNEMIRLVNDPGGSTAVGTGVSIAFAPHHSGTETASIRAIAETTGAGTGIQLYTHSGASLTEKVRIDKDGKVGIGTTSPNTLLHLSTTGGTQLRLTAAADNYAYLEFGDTSDEDIGRIQYSNIDNHMAFITNAAERMRIDSSAIRIPDDTWLTLGASNDLGLIHDASNSYIANYYGAMYFDQHVHGGNMIFRGEDSSGNLDEYFAIDGGAEKFMVKKALEVDIGAPGSADKTLALFKSEAARQIGFVWDDSLSTLGIATLTNHALSFHTNGNSAERMRIQADGDVMIGWATESNFYKNARVGIWESTAEKFALSVRHDGNATTSWGLSIVCGTNDASGTNTAIDIVDGDGSGQGAITFSGGTVTYGAFTANHDIELPDADNSAGYAYGTLVETTEIFYKQKDGANTERGIQYKVQKSSSANSKAVLGAYSNKYDTEDNLHQVLILGDGHILCNNSGGNIAVGDGICTSSTAGIGAKATVSPSMIIGIAQKDITFSGSETKLVPVQYGLQQFTPWT